MTLYDSVVPEGNYLLSVAIQIECSVDDYFTFVSLEIEYGTTDHYCWPFMAASENTVQISTMSPTIPNFPINSTGNDNLVITFQADGTGNTLISHYSYATLLKVA